MQEAITYVRSSEQEGTACGIWPAPWPAPCPFQQRRLAEPQSAAAAQPPPLQGAALPALVLWLWSQISPAGIASFTLCSSVCTYYLSGQLAFCLSVCSPAPPACDLCKCLKSTATWPGNPCCCARPESENARTPCHQVQDCSCTHSKHIGEGGCREHAGQGDLRCAASLAATHIEKGRGFEPDKVHAMMLCCLLL